MGEFIRFLLISNVSLLVVWLGYKLLLNKNTFHGLNRAYLLVGSVLSLIVPFIPIGRATSETLVGFQLPAIEVGSGIVPTEAFSLPVNFYSIVYAFGAMVALWLFAKSVSSLVKLVRESESEILMGELVLRSDKAGPFSFLSIIHLPKKLSTTNLETILRHEMAHVQLGHSYDVLWLSFLRILFWFNPLLTYYLRTIQEIHEYQADALTHISSTKEHYVKVQLDQLFQLPSDLSFANSFYNSINLKKRVNMIYSEKTSKWGITRYLVAIPLGAAICLLVACTDSVPPPPPPPPSTAEVEASPKKQDYSSKEVDEMPEFPGGMEELGKFLGATIKYPKEAEKDGIEGRVYIQFIVTEEGQVVKAIPTNSVREDIDKEAVRAVLEMPKWSPGIKDGKPVAVEMTLPIVFKLD
ncbi:MAG: M56 family metallopeptidase [Flavobacteriales bacterium]